VTAAGTTGAAARTAAIAAARTASAISVAAVTGATAIPPLAPSAARFGPWEQIDDVEEIALLLRVRRRILAAQHAHQAHVVRAVAHDLERLHQTGEPIAGDRQLLFDLGGGLHGAVIDRRRGGRVGGSLALDRVAGRGLVRRRRLGGDLSLWSRRCRLWR
jgi:hypothetical protein